jgi:hypothetical protein
MVTRNRARPAGAARRLASVFALSLLVASAATAQEKIVDDEVTERVIENGAPRQTAQRWSHTGLLRGRDLTPFGLLRLDMLPAHTADAEPGTWVLEILYAYQNTFVMSENVRSYLGQRNIGRQPLRPEDAAAILALPGDAYYVDGEIGYADLIVQRRINDYWSVYFTVPYISYGSGVLDSTIESFHDTFGFSQQGRDLVARNEFQIVYGIGDVRFAMLDRSTAGGFGDPVVGIRYSFPEPRFGWDIVMELAAKFAIDGERFLLSTGRHDYGAQITLQRRLGKTGRHAVYLSGSGVYYAGGPEIPGDRSELIPTFLAGYSYGLTPRTSIILQGYVSQSVIQDTTLEELKEEKYQMSLGVQSRSKNILLSLAVTENISNFNNTPDIGVQFGIAYMPKAK